MEIQSTRTYLTTGCEREHSASITGDSSLAKFHEQPHSAQRFPRGAEHKGRVTMHDAGLLSDNDRALQINHTIKRPAGQNNYTFPRRTQRRNPARRMSTVPRFQRAAVFYISIRWRTMRSAGQQKNRPLRAKCPKKHRTMGLPCKR